MTIDFDTPMTFYELLAIILSAIAIVIPIAQWIWKKWITKPILNHLITGKAFLFINRSGSYIQIEGVYDAQNKPVLIRKISLKLISLNCQVKCNTLCKKTSSGVFQPRHLRGRRLSNFATASTSSCVTSAKEVRLGKN